MCNARKDNYIVRSHKVAIVLTNIITLLVLEGDMGWISCQTRHHINMIRLWNKFINMEESRITKRVFNLD